MKRTLLLSVVFFSLFITRAQSDLVKKGIKHSLKEFKELAPERQKDRIRRATPAYLPDSGVTDTNQLKEYCQKVAQQMRIRYVDSRTIPQGESEVETGKVDIEISCFPGFNMYAAIKSIKNQNGNNVVIPYEEKEKLIEEGYLDRGMGIVVEGFNLQSAYFYPTEEDWESEMEMKGQLYCSYPVMQEVVILDSSNIGQPIVFSGDTFKLLKLEHNVAILRKPQERYSEVKVMPMNKDNCLFGSSHTSSTAYYIYKAGKEKDFELTEKEIDKLAKQNPSDSKESAMLITVPGTIGKILLYKPVNYLELKVPFSRSFTMGFR